MLPAKSGTLSLLGGIFYETNAIESKTLKLELIEYTLKIYSLLLSLLN